MFTIKDIHKLTEFDCWCCLPVVKCEKVGSMDCRIMIFINMASEMILKGEY